MKIKCDDGIVRSFYNPPYDYHRYGGVEAICEECGKDFGVHDTKIIKPLWKKHVCKPEDMVKRNKVLEERKKV